MSESEHLRLAREMADATNRAAATGELEDWLSHFSEEIVWEAAEEAPDAGTYRGHAAIRGYMEDWLATVDGMQWEIKELTEITDDVILAGVRATARVKGTEHEMAIDYAQVVFVKDGKVVRIKEFLAPDEARAYAEAQKGS
jgi:ketosteroid isomerase-like protein